MPIREYQCKQCDHAFEKIEGARKTPRWCPVCGRRTAHRRVSTANAVFKGEGFHVNDYPAKGPVAGKKKPSPRTKQQNVQRGIERVAKRLEQGHAV